MAQVYIIAGIIITISVLICVIYIRQTIIKRAKEKARLHRALDKRAKDLVQMLNAFPPNFLPRDLLVFIHRCIVDVFEQLSKVAPDEPEYLEHFKAYTGHMETVIRMPAKATEVVLQSSTQINEIRQYLNYLGQFLQKWMERGNISAKQYSLYKELLKRLITQLMVDNYTLSAKQAVQLEKPKLAIHYYMLAKSVLTKEGALASKKERLLFINQELQHLEQKVREEELRNGVTTVTSPEENEGNEATKQWQKFEENAEWKKKNIYD
jgi:hypothetical protein